ncbi:MAG: cell division protein ZapA [Pseudomonadota bacterium]
MPEIKIAIGGREFTVACGDGEEDFLRVAADMLDQEATAVVSQAGRMPEARMLLMAGLMLADRTAAFEDRAKAAEEKLAAQEKLIDEMNKMPASPAQAERIEVPVIPKNVLDGLAAIAAQAEELAQAAEKKTTG